MWRMTGRGVTGGIYSRPLACVFMSLVPVSLQSTPRYGFFSLSCWLLIMATVSIGGNPEFSASAVGMDSSQGHSLVPSRAQLQHR